MFTLETIMQDPDLDGIDIITSSQSFIQSSKTSVEEEAGRLLNDGLTTRNQTRMAAGLQILYNMKQMEQKVDELLQSISDELAREIRRAVDMSSLQREMRGNYGYHFFCEFKTNCISRLLFWSCCSTCQPRTHLC